MPLTREDCDCHTTQGLRHWRWGRPSRVVLCVFVCDLCVSELSRRRDLVRVCVCLGVPLSGLCERSIFVVPK